MTSETRFDFSPFSRSFYSLASLKRERERETTPENTKRATSASRLKVHRFSHAFSKSLWRGGGEARGVSKALKMVDFEGQKFVETFTVSVVSSTSFVGFTLGYVLPYNVMRNVFSPVSGLDGGHVTKLAVLKRNPSNGGDRRRASFGERRGRGRRGGEEGKRERSETIDPAGFRVVV